MRIARFAVFFFVAGLLFTAGCSPKRPPVKRFKQKPPVQKIEREKTSVPGVKKEVIRKESASSVYATTPKSRASSKMVETGRGHLAAGNFSDAERVFQDAVNVDPNNGIAYYYLAKTKFELGQFVPANGLLDKAEALLAGSEEWTEAVEVLREMIKEQI